MNRAYVKCMNLSIGTLLKTKDGKIFHLKAKGLGVTGASTTIENTSPGMAAAAPQIKAIVKALDVEIKMIQVRLAIQEFLISLFKKFVEKGSKILVFRNK